MKEETVDQDELTSAVVIETGSGGFLNYEANSSIGARALPGEILCGRIDHKQWEELTPLELEHVPLEMNIVEDKANNRSKLYYLALLTSVPDIYIALVQRATESMVAVTPVFVPTNGDLRRWRTYYLRG